MEKSNRGDFLGKNMKREIMQGGKRKKREAYVSLCSFRLALMLQKHDDANQNEHPPQPAHHKRKEPHCTEDRHIGF